MRHLPLTMVGLGALPLLAGCVHRGQYGEPGPTYPPDVTQADVLNIQVALRPQNVRFTNTTARSFSSARLWLNAWYSASLEDIDVGESVVVPLDRFTDEHGLRPRSGGFFAARASEPIVLAQLEVDGTFYGLVLVNPDAR